MAAVAGLSSVSSASDLTRKRSLLQSFAMKLMLLMILCTAVTAKAPVESAVESSEISVDMYIEQYTYGKLTPCCERCYDKFGNNGWCSYRWQGCGLFGYQATTSKGCALGTSICDVKGQNCQWYNPCICCISKKQYVAFNSTFHEIP
ncbi:uncharacterized protein LOC108676595 [Hyalella azteca]|uniref:Uncharacterized protein LOC108676595 n=1 Tax=Hyalella azteca TaxID=294128 RepID=A0A8B7P252_HYAAZ|nr:uncharacterized protein LOC108676595 [Hyalella azteca]